MSVGVVTFGVSLLLFGAVAFVLHVAVQRQRGSPVNSVTMADAAAQPIVEPQFVLVVGTTPTNHVLVHLRTVRSIVVVHHVSEVTDVLQCLGMTPPKRAEEWTPERIAEDLKSAIRFAIASTLDGRDSRTDRDPVLASLGRHPVLGNFFTVDSVDIETAKKEVSFSSEENKYIHSYFADIQADNVSWRDINKGSALIGQGLTSQVFHGTWNGIDVAVKAITVDGVAVSLYDTCVETAIQGSFLHPNLVTLFGISATYHGVGRMSVSLIMEWLPISLDDLMNVMPYKATFQISGFTARCDLCHKIGCGLQFLHDHGVIHRDVSPRNILLDEGLETVKLCDFGFAVFSESIKPEGNSYVGTPRYSSPEVARLGSYSLDSDLYALGCVVGEVFLAQRPFAGLSEAQVLGAVVGGVSPFPLLDDLWDDPSPMELHGGPYRNLSGEHLMQLDDIIPSTTSRTDHSTYAGRWLFTDHISTHHAASTTAPASAQAVEITESQQPSRQDNSVNGTDLPVMYTMASCDPPATLRVSPECVAFTFAASDGVDKDVTTTTEDMPSCGDTITSTGTGSDSMTGRQEVNSAETSLWHVPTVVARAAKACLRPVPPRLPLPQLLRVFVNFLCKSPRSTS
eukprot:CAMPEP_0119145418 /NCGR_PEP_ID=MMETSP1310-20130426/37487_1 /TAXON_ID=464262 /ORGANISM="Genus nov. species nov., Strain RCC2339" /LENGTH=624 /DNA_ID=CAMNT_0007137231 /DNA_START=623 /DNA_END=2493 /DNA_ORIENTATION=-